MPLVPTVRTPLSAAAAERELRAAWRRRFGSGMPSGALRNALALWDLETNQGASMHNNNWGNIIATNPNVDFWLADDSGNLRRFRSFNTRRAGADSFISLLTRPTRAHWRRGLLSGDPRKFAHLLKGDPEKNLAAYYEAPEAVYTRTLVRRWQRYPHLGGGDHGAAYGAIALAAMAAGAAYYFHRRSRGRRGVRR